MNRKWIVALLIVGAISAPFALVFGPIIGLATLGSQADTTAVCLAQGGAVGGAPTGAAQDAIPSNLMPIFKAAQQKYGVPWNILAGINRVETDFGRNMAVSSAGAIGWMQFMPATWATYGVDANNDGKKDPMDPADAIFTAAKYLRAGGAPKNIRAAIFSYNHANWYVDEVLSYAKKYAHGSPFGSILTPPLLGAPVQSGGDCGLSDSGVPGKVTIAPGANKPGQPIKQLVLEYVARMAGIYGKTIVVTTGTNHSYYTVDGNVSDHATGNATDLGMIANGGTDDSPIGDKIATACLMVAGVPDGQAASMANAGGLWTLHHNHMRIQCIWKTYEGGNHHNHVHVGVQPE
jgi:hypothetical protein